MSLVSTKCPSCGGEIQLDDEKKSGFCLYCGSKIDVNEALNPKANNLTGSDEDVEKWKAAFDTYLHAFDYTKAEQIADKILQAQPTDQDSIGRYSMIKIACKLEIDANGNLKGFKEDKYNEEKRIVIPSGITSINRGAFKTYKNNGKKCDMNIEEIIIPGTVRSIEWPISKIETKIRFVHSDVYKIDENGFIVSMDGAKIWFGLSSLNKVELPASIKSIGDFAFSDFNKLSSVEMDGIESIGDGAFYGCSSLNEVKMDGVKSIGESAFVGCSSLRELNMDGIDSIGDSAFCGCISLSEVKIEGVKSIGDSIFYGCSNLVEIKIPKSVKSLGNNSFMCCESLSEVKMEGVKSIGNKTFFGCNNLVEVKMDGVESIGDSAFEDCESLREVKMEGVKSIGDSAFQECKCLSEVRMDGVKSIGDLAFSDCISLSKVKMDGVKSIGEYAFCGCISLREVKMNGVESIGDSAFWDCESLSEVLLPTNTIVENDAFSGDTIIRLITPEEMKKKNQDIKRKESSEKYWQEHSDELDKLSKKKNKALGELNSLGIFSGKRKKELEAIINEIDSELNKDR